MPIYTVSYAGKEYDVQGDHPPTEGDMASLTNPQASQQAQGDSDFAGVGSFSTPTNAGSSQAETQSQGSTQQSLADQAKNELLRGVLTSTASTIGSVNGAIKLIQKVTNNDASGNGILERASANLNTMANQLPSSDNPFISIPANLVGSIPALVS